MDSIPKLLTSVITIVIGVLLCISFIISSVVVDSARTYHSSVIDQIEASDFSEVVINECLDAADRSNYNLFVELVESETSSYQYYKVTLRYGLYAPIFGKVHVGTIVGYALPSTHAVGMDKNVVVPGLYETGSNYTKLLITWDDLIKDGVIYNDGGVVSTHFTSGVNSSSDILAGDLLFPWDGSVTEIADRGFFACTKLTGFKFSDGITNIGEQAFAGNSELTRVSLGKELGTIKYNAFDYDGNIERVDYAGTLDTWCSIAFEKGQSNPCYYGAALYIDDALIQDVTIPLSTTSIKNVFIGCSSIKSVVFPNGCQVNTIDSYAFRYCNNLKTLKIENSVTSLGEYVFLECTSLEDVTLPSTVTSIGNECFRYCTSLKNINYNGTKAQWDSINLASDWNNDTGTYTIHCSDGDISK